MPRLSQQKQQQNLVSRLFQLKFLFSQIQQEIEQLSSIGELAQLGSLDYSLSLLEEEAGLIGITSGKLTRLSL
jgi:hypothetical protein